MGNEQAALSALFRPFSSDKLNLNNRIAMAPMTRGFSPHGVPGADVAAYYKRRAAGGAGLIITEGTLINHPAAAGSDRWPEFHGEAALAGWANVVQEVHAAGGRIVPQLWHVGTTRKLGDLPNVEAKPVGPSGLDAAGNPVNEPLSLSEIDQIIEAFATAAADAKRLGFDGIELHGAHGYLIDQFFWSRTNRRSDQYGGATIADRAKFAAEIIRACRSQVGDSFPIIIRLSQWKGADYAARNAETPAELEQWLTPLADAGADIFHCSTRRFWLPEFEGSTLNLAGWAKQLTGKATITVGSVGLAQEYGKFDAPIHTDVERLEELASRIDAGEFDLVAIGRALLADPAWPNKVREGRLDELEPFSPAALGTLE